jgi:diguanylate cyclase (GGDEF)-like protein
MVLSPEALTVALVNAASDYLVVLDRQHRVVFANKAFANAFLGGREASGADFLSLVDAASTVRALDTLGSLDTGPRQVELYHAGPDNKVHPVHYSMGLMELSEVQLIAAVGRDKTPDLELLGTVTRLNMELENKQKELSEAYARMEQLAIIDQVTELYNRHYFFTVVQHFFEEARRYSQPLSCLMMDLDNFKAINDAHGHMFGDHVLRAVANRLKANSRKADLLARYGGEEFVLMTPNTNLKTARGLAERIRGAIERERFSVGEINARLTISIGLSGTEVVSQGPLEALIDSADQALYSAKRAGRNRCATYLPPPSLPA